MIRLSHLACAVGLALLAGQACAQDDLAIARQKVAQAVMPANHWDGPTTGPKAVGHKTIVFVAADLNNGGILGAWQGVQEAAAAIGWDARVIDGQGTVSGRTAAMDQALALRPDGIVAGGFDTSEQKVAFQDAVRSGVVLVGWHSGEQPGPNPAAGLFANITTSPTAVAEIAADWAVADSGGKAGVVIFTDSQYAIATLKSRAMAAAIQRCTGCRVLDVEDSPISDVSTRIPELTTSLLQRFGTQWTYALAINDLYFDFMGPTLRAAGIPGDGPPRAVSAGDGSVAAYERIRHHRYQSATVAEPLNMQGWEIVDELNRAFAKVPWSGYVPQVHLVTAANIGTDGGPTNQFDPDNNYRAQYRKIWGKLGGK